MMRTNASHALISLLELGIILGAGAFTAMLLAGPSTAAPLPEAERVGVDLDGVPLPPGGVARMGSTRFRHGAEVKWIAFTPDGKTLISLGNSEVVFWDAATGSVLRRQTEPDDDRAYSSAFNFIALSPDGKMFASGGVDKTVRLWDVATGKEIRRLQNRTPEDRSYRSIDGVVAFSPDGKTLASFYAPKMIRLWEVASGKLAGEFELPSANPIVNCLVFSPDSKTLAIGSTDQNGAVRLWDVATRKENGRFAGHRGSGLLFSAYSINALAFAPDGKTVASAAANDPTIRLWDAATYKEIRRLRAGPLLHIYGHIECVAFSPDGRIVAGETDTGSLSFWEATTGKEIRTIERAHTAQIKFIVFSPDGKTLASAGGDGRIALWDAATGKEVSPSGGHRNVIRSLVMAPDGTNLATSAEDGTVRLWEVKTGKELCQLEGYKSGGISGFSACPLAYSPDGKLLAAGDMENNLRLWDPATGKKVRDCPHGEFVANGFDRGSFAFSADGKSLITSTRPTTVRLREVESGREVRKLTVTPGYRAVLSPEGKLLGGLVDSNKVCVWDIATGKEQCRFGEKLRNRISAFTFSSDGKIVATASYPHVNLWDALTGKEIRQLEGKQPWVVCLAFSPDGTLLATGGDDKIVRLWDTGSGKEVGQFEGHCGSVTVITFSADEKTLASASADTTVLAWKVSKVPRKGNN